MKILWSDSYSVGNKELDSQHKELFNIINKLNTLIDKEITGNSISKLLIDMSNYVEIHFRTEERLLEEINYPGYHDQMNSHEDFILKTIDLFDTYNTDPEAIDLVEINNYLFNWLSEHILKEDMMYKEYFEKK